MANDKSKRRATKKKPAARAARKPNVSAKKKTSAKNVVVKKAAKTPAKKVAARKSVSIKTARVSKRALLPPLPPPSLFSAQAKRSAARVPSRAKVLGRARAMKTGKAVFDIPACTEAELRQKLRLARPYLELWLVQANESSLETGAATSEAAFVRIWQWLMLGATLEGSHVVITPELVKKLFDEEIGRGPAI